MEYSHRAAATIALAAMLACNSSSTEPEPDSEPVTARISGPAEAYISDGTAPAIFRSSESEGDISDRIWSITKQDGESSDPVKSSRFEPEIRDPGTYTVSLRVESEQSVAHDTTHNIEVYPAIRLDFPAPIAFSRYEGSGVERRGAFLFTFDPESGAVQQLSEEEYNDGRLSWSPDGRYLAVSVHTDWSSDDVGVLDTETGEHHIFTDNMGLSWTTAWNPKKNIIAFVDRYRTSNRSYDELFLVLLNPEDISASEVYSPAGEQTDSDYYGQFPSWSPDGEFLALGDVPFHGREVRRVAVFSDILGEPSKSRLVPEDSVLAFVKRVTGREYPSNRIYSGSQAVAWSPDGRWIAYNMVVGHPGPDYRNLLVKAAADGSGRMRLINDFAGKLTWSPDGNFIYFNNDTRGLDGVPDDALLKVHSGGGSEYERVLSNAISPAWYNH